MASRSRSIGRSVQYLVLEPKLLREVAVSFWMEASAYFLGRGVQSLGVWFRHRCWGSAAACMHSALCGLLTPYRRGMRYLIRMEPAATLRKLAVPHATETPRRARGKQ